MPEEENVEEIIRIVSYDAITTIMQCTTISLNLLQFPEPQPYSISFIQIFLGQLRKECHTNSQKIL
jgi:predicted membrane channel-forming protein YqfA (hemolysin III family)